MTHAPPLRGREPELGVIGDALAGVRAGNAGMLLVEGRAGHGKTRLLDEIESMAARSSVRLGRAASVPHDRLVQLGALLSALFGGPEPLLDPVALSDVQASPEQRYWLLDQLASLLEQRALNEPLIVALDDMQWTTASCRDAMRTLPTRLAGLPILWVFAFREERLAPELQALYVSLEDQLGARRLTLGPLDGPAVEQIARDVMGGEPDEALLELISGAQGSPFLTVELLRGLREDGLVAIESGSARLREVRLPSRVRDGMRDRLLRLSQQARHTAQVASVMSGSFSFGWLAAMLDLAPSALLAPVEELRDADLISEADGELAFRHELLREAVLETLPQSARRALQRQAADALTSSGAAPVEVAALLARSAERGDTGAVATLRQAAQALGAYDPSAAADLGRRAFELSTVDDPHRAALVAETVLLLYAADRTAEGEQFADEALGGALTPEQQADIRLSIAQMYSISADVRAANGRVALDLPGISDSLRARHLVWLTHNLAAAGRVAEARVVAGDAEAAVEHAGDQSARFRLAVVEASLDLVSGRFGDSLARLERASQLPSTRRDLGRDLSLEATRTEALAAAGDCEKALKMTVDGLAAAQRDRHAFGIRTWEQYRGRRLLEVGRLDDAAAALEGSIEFRSAARRLNSAEAAAIVALGRAALHLGDAGLAADCTRLAQEMLDAGVPDVRRHAAWLLMLQTLGASDPAGVRRLLDALGPDARESVLPQIRFDVADAPQLVRAALAIADDALADAAVRASEERYRLNPDVNLLAGVAAHARGLRVGDPGDLAAAVDLLASAERPMAHASVSEDLGRSQLEGGARDDGVASLGRALELYAECGAAWDAGRVRARLRALGIRRRLTRSARPASGWAGLTDSELNVAQLVAQGLTNREVAGRMFLSPHTVSMHLRHVFAKLDINSRVELTRLVIAHEGADRGEGPPP